MPLPVPAFAPVPALAPVPPLSVPAGPPVRLAAAPLHGLTVLVVEDSRFASEALRLICQRAGARLRRAESLALARLHLAVYRPDVVIVDLGLPDGPGEGLIAALAAMRPRPGVILGTSGDPAGRTAALAAGADGFVEKPLRRTADLVAALLAHLPDRSAATGDAEALPCPDRLALHDDLQRAADLAACGPDRAGRRYLAGFVAGVARLSGDRDLEAAARAAAGPAADRGEGPDAWGRLEQGLQQRLADATRAFDPG
jgi:CheY-like chemotaxis protein